ncbi:GlcNAc-PI de-N-acetylase [Monaibacterium marinum]|uniref:GlcNAc-PI de-N-acetylase n=1 Tax=Pontivivens marinum TaxID=1690039 RepID=A0A2C9CPN0_9RHOB|nr:PIG-L family deacetylase [Monaibacterium marinum]SOH93294.1 GlcNAc-PI de-N-acetylase [Monaibacterium marinum]
MTPDQSRIAAERTAPRIVRLGQALSALRSVVGFMNTGAHPDDETSAMLAAMRFRDGIALSYACSTRGEGGQNDIGRESGPVLGTLRTAEMEQASAVLDMNMYWLSQRPNDIHDFRFSKSGKETLAIWGRERTLARFVHIIRLERPDAICPTFLDVPGQHGHHRAMTELAHDVFAAAADPAFDSDLPVWQVSKLYLPAWSGAGQAYDDDLPPPPATMVVPGGIDPLTGWSFERIGQQSRAYHRTQAMGNWVPAGSEREFPLHLAATRLSGVDTAITDGLPSCLADLADHAALAQADAAIGQAAAGFPVGDAICGPAAAALHAVRVAEAAMSDAETALHGHRLQRVQRQLTRVLAEASGLEVHARVHPVILRPGDVAAVTVEARAGTTTPETTVVTEGDWSLSDGGLVAPATYSDPYPDIWCAGQPDAPCVEVRFNVAGVDAVQRIAFEAPPVVVPAVTGMVAPSGVLINRAAPREVSVAVREVTPAGATPTFDLPTGWAMTENGMLDVPDDAQPGTYEARLMLDGMPADTLSLMAYPHVATRAFAAPATLRVCVLDAVLPKVKIAYVGGGNDNVAHWLRAMGLDVEEPDNEALIADLDQFDTVVIGIFAVRFRGLTDIMAKLREWVEAGGTLLTLYHRPWDDWDANVVPPRMLEIGSPSLRFRVTNAQADVDVQQPQHPLFNTPNVIADADWQDWDKERGLYFAKSWDEVYTPLLSLHDPDEAPLQGALLSADIGAGRHTHCALNLHHQMQSLTPGAFRLMANLVAKR